MEVDLFRPFIPKEAEEYVLEVLRSRFIGQGPKVDQFEKEFCKIFSVPGAVAVNSGTAALETAYDLIGLKKGDEVISTPLTCTATNLPLLHRGVKIVWADILPDTLCIDPADVRRKLNGKTKAVVQVHLGGIRAEVENVGVPVVSDAAQALGIFVGDYTACSFQAIKHLTTADGGMLVPADKNMVHRAKLLRWFGIDREKKVANNWQMYRQRKMTFDIELPGYKRQMNDLAAALGLAGLLHYDRMLSHRADLFHHYADRLKGKDGITLVDGKRNTYWLCTVLVENRDAFAQMLFEADVDTNLVQIRNDAFRVFGGKKADLPVMKEVEDKYLSLPIGMHVTHDQVDYVCDKIEGGW